MNKYLKKICIIPARGGSKRIRKKNIKNFCGKPIIAYSIEAAIKSKCFDRIIVSTEDKEIAKVALKYSAEVPFFRPTRLAGDATPILLVTNHTIKQMIKIGQKPDLVCIIIATSPLLDYKNIQKSLKILLKYNKQFVFTATSFPHPIQRAFILDKNKNIFKMFSQSANINTQKLKETYHDAGQLYWGKAEAYLKKIEPFSKNSRPLILDRSDVVDINTIEDWKKAEITYKVKKIIKKTKQ